MTVPTFACGPVSEEVGRRWLLAVVVGLVVGVGPQPALAAPPASGPAPAAPPASGLRRLAIPDPAAVAEAERLVRQMFRANYEVKSAPERRAFAQKLLHQGVATTDDPACRYVLLREAREVATGVGDVTTAFAAIDRLAQYFIVDAPVMRLGALEIASRAATPETMAEVQRGGQMLANVALFADDFDRAEEVQQLVEAAGRRALPVAEQARVVAWGRELRAMKAEYQAVKPAMDTLAAAPDDAPAALAVGRYWCVSRGQWSRGLLFLTVGSDAGLQAAAVLDLARPLSAVDQIRVGEAWDRLADKETGKAKVAFQNRALSWYVKALPSANELRRAALEPKIKALVEALGSQREYPVPTVVPTPTPRVPIMGVLPPPPSPPVTPAPSVLGTTFKVQPLNFSADELVVSPVGRWLAVTNGYQVLVRDTETGAVLRLANPAARQKICLLTASTDGRRLGQLRYAQDAPTTYDVVFQDTTTGREARIGRVVSDDRPTHLWFGPDGSRALVVALWRTQALKYTATVYDATSGRLCWRADAGTTDAAAFTPDGKRLILSGLKGNLAVHDALTGRVVQTLEPPPDLAYSTEALTITPDGRNLLSAHYGGATIVWDLSTGQPQSHFISPIKATVSIACSPDGGRVAILGTSTLAVHETHTGRLVAFWTIAHGVRRLQFTSDGRTLMTNDSDQALLAWPLPR